MRITVVGCGDAFGSGGRFNTCYLVEAGGRTLALDFGASSLVALKQMGIAPNSLDAVLISHLHGDHFGGLPFLLLDCQFNTGRSAPFSIVGPVGTATRVPQLLEVFFAGSSQNNWHFGVDVVDMPCRTRTEVAGFEVESFEVIHPSGAPSTGVRVRHGDTLLAFSGDTMWTDALINIAEGADLLILECLRYSQPVPYHLDLPTIEARRHLLGASAIMLTHMGPDMLAKRSEIAAKGYLMASDGLIIDL